MQFALAFIPLIGVAATAVDFSRANAVRARMQQVLDSAVLAGAKDASANWQSVALALFNGNGGFGDATVSSPTFTLANSTYSGAVSGTVPTRMLGVFGFSVLRVATRSAAAAGSGSPDTSCLLALDGGQPAQHPGITFNGAPNINFSGCTIRSDSSITCNGHGGLASASIATGTASGCTNPQSGASPVPDIYASIATNITTKCAGTTPGVTWTAGTLPSGAGFKTVGGGSYTEYHVCGDLTLSGSGYLTGSAPASDTVIVVENGGVIISAGAAISTSRVTIVLTGNNSRPSTITFPNGNGHAAILSLSPSIAADNPWRGVSLYRNPILTNGVDDDWGPGATFNVDGVVYMPKSNLTLRGSSASNLTRCTKIVVNSFQTNGSVDLVYSQSTDKCALLGVKQWAGTAARLVQ